MASLTLNIEDEIKRAVIEEIARVKEEVIREALVSYEKQVREIVGTVAVNAAKYYSVEHIGTILQVRIQTGEKR